MSSDSVLSRSDTGTILLRKSLTAVFFLRRPADEVLDHVQAALHTWLDFVPPEGKSFCLVGSAGSEEKPFTAARLKRCLDQLDPTKFEEREDAFFLITGPTHFGPDWSFETSLEADVDGRRTDCHYIDLLFPLEMGLAPKANSVLALLDSLASELPLDSGFATPTLYLSDSTDVKSAMDLIPRLAFRHPGLDISTTDGTATEIGGHCRGARWITFLGEALVSALGGSERVSKGAPAGVDIARLGNKIRIRAGESAELGDVNRLDNLPLLRSLAAQLEPITLFGDGTIRATLGARAKQWERRFLD